MFLARIEVAQAVNVISQGQELVSERARRCAAIRRLLLGEPHSTTQQQYRSVVKYSKLLLEGNDCNTVGLLYSVLFINLFFLYI